MSFVKRSEAAPDCHSKPLDSVKNWNDHFFWVDSTAFLLSVSLKSKVLKILEPFLCWVDISRYYTLDENCYLTFCDGDEEMDLFAFICHSDPTKVRIGERELAKREVKLLKLTEGRTVSLNPLVSTASGDSGDSFDKLFDEADDAEQEHFVGRDDDVLDETVAKDVSESSEAGADRHLFNINNLGIPPVLSLQFCWSQTSHTKSSDEILKPFYWQSFSKQ
nr:hypothetical protein [Tanacetum cinerariifolium]